VVGASCTLNISFKHTTGDQVSNATTRQNPRSQPEKFPAKEFDIK
jgi:hypothetical protein